MSRTSNSSTALRTFEPYLYLFPRWVESYPKIFFGGGAGSSRQIVEGTGIVLTTVVLGSVVDGKEVSNPFAVTEVYVCRDDAWSLGSLSFARLINR